jgi:hypothetical protein
MGRSLNKYKVYVDGTCFGSCFGWYDTRLFMRKLARKYKSARIYKEKCFY